jgi:hypothetical protein
MSRFLNAYRDRIGFPRWLRFADLRYVKRFKGWRRR